MSSHATYHLHLHQESSPPYPATNSSESAQSGQGVIAQNNPSSFLGTEWWPFIWRKHQREGIYLLFRNQFPGLRALSFWRNVPLSRDFPLIDIAGPCLLPLSFPRLIRSYQHTATPRFLVQHVGRYEHIWGKYLGVSGGNLLIFSHLVFLQHTVITLDLRGATFWDSRFFHATSSAGGAASTSNPIFLADRVYQHGQSEGGRSTRMVSTFPNSFLYCFSDCPFSPGLDLRKNVFGPNLCRLGISLATESQSPGRI